MTWTATTTIRAPRARVTERLLDARALPTWNPAITSVGRNESRELDVAVHRVRIRGLLPARLTIHTTAGDVIGYELAGLGSTEQGTWRVEGLDGHATKVTHAFHHEGWLLGLNSGAFTDVAAWRLERLRLGCERPVS